MKATAATAATAQAQARAAAHRAARVAPPAWPADVRWMQRITRWVLMLAAATLLLLALTWLLRQPAFALGRVRLDGDLNRSSVATIRANAMPRLQGNFFTLDLQEARNAFESVPWVRRAEVRRHWPDELRVWLQEHRAVALWEQIGVRDRTEDRLVGLDGTVFQANPGDVEDENLPTFRGPAGTSAEMLALHGPLQQALAPIGRLAGGRERAQIALLELSSRGSWAVELDTGARIELGRGSREVVLARSERFARTLAQATEPFGRRLLHADLRHAEGYALRLAGITTAAALAATAAPGSARGVRPKP